MTFAPSAQLRRKAKPLQILEDLKKIGEKIKNEENEDVERLNVPPSTLVKEETGPDDREHLHGNSSLSELSELQDSESDVAPTTFGNEAVQLAIEDPQERSKRRRNTTKTYAEPDSSSEDLRGYQKGREIVVKNTWAENDSEESEIDSTASYTNEDDSDSSDNQSETSDFSQGIQGEETEEEMGGGLDDSLDGPPDRVQGFPIRRLNSEQYERSRISKAKFKYMVTHGTLNEVQRSKPWEVIAEECGVTASLKDISKALKQAGVPYGDRLDPTPRAAPSQDQDAPSVPRSLSSQASKSSTQNSGSSTIKLTARDMELVIVAFQCLKDGCKFQVDYGKLADLAGLKNPGSASAVWSGIREKLMLKSSLSRLTTREVELLGLAFQSLKDGCIVQIDQKRFAEHAGFSSASSGNASWLLVKKKLMKSPSLVAHASPAAAAPLQKRKRSPTTITIEDTESEDVMSTPKRRRGNAGVPTEVAPGAKARNLSTSQIGSGDLDHKRHWTVPKTHRSPNSRQCSHQNTSSMTRISNVDKSRRLPDPLQLAISLTKSPRLHASSEPANSEVPINNDNISETLTTSRSSVVSKKKNMVWNLEAEHMLLLAIIEVRGYQMDYEAVAERLGCTSKAVTQYLAKLRKEIRGRNDPVPLARPQKVTTPIVWTNRSSFTVAAAKPNDSTAHHGFPNATHTKDALFIKNEIAKLEASVGGDNEHRPWSKDEENALERGLRRFSGPFWSDIIAMFGPQGSVNDVLKDRDEAQLENKACRMKISFLKSGVKFPFYLRLVTGARKKAPTVVIDDREWKMGDGEDDGRVTGGVAEAAGEAPASPEHAVM